MIPRLVHRYWSGAERPAFVASFGCAWEDLHPEWEVITWSEAMLPPPILDYLDEWQHLVPGDLRHRSNMVRYLLLAQFGGVWVDCDVLPLRAIDNALDLGPFIATIDGRHAEGAVIGLPPRHPFAEHLLRALPTHPGELLVEVSGADFLRSILAAHPEVHRCAPADWFTYGSDGEAIQGEGERWTEHLWWSSSRTVGR